ncbi:MAG: hypothetical protein NTY38_33695 [Acidobacteria bacterium]|nr:hypothetical protein [Acidobacteriota bacterium]
MKVVTRILCCLFPYACLLGAAGPVVIRSFDFGSDVDVKIESAPQFHQRVGRVYRSPRYLWFGPITDAEIEGETDPVLRTGTAGQRGEFWVGLDDGGYQVTLIMADRNRARGPFDIYFQDQLARSGVRLEPGKVSKVTFPVKVSGHKLRLRFEAEARQTFLVNGMIIEGPAGTKFHRLFQDAPLDFLPTREEVLTRGSTDARAALRSYCEWLLAHRRPNGFLGDWGSYGTSREPQYYWYTAAYPIRTLLAGYEIFGEKRYRAAAESILDHLVQEQLPNGAFQQVFRDKPTAALSPEEIRNIIAHQWMNTADVGSIVTALAVAAHYAEEPRKTLYRSAAKRYCDEFALQWQKESGGFTNGLVSGKPETNIYSVATGTQAAEFAAVYAITGEEKYLKVAERAALFLAGNFSSDGRPLAYPFSPRKPVVPYLEPLTHLGEIFYHHDGILFVYQQSKDERFREKIRAAYQRHVMGSMGLMSTTEGDVWWALQDSWNNSKSAAMPLVLLVYQRMTHEPRVDAFLASARRFLSTPEFSRRIGIMLEDPDLPWGGHSLQSWTGCTVAATGFGGLSLAEFIQPGVVWLR